MPPVNSSGCCTLIEESSLSICQVAQGHRGKRLRYSLFGVVFTCSHLLWAKTLLLTYSVFHSFVICLFCLLESKTNPLPPKKHKHTTNKNPKTRKPTTIGKKKSQLNYLCCISLVKRIKRNQKQTTEAWELLTSSRFLNKFMPIRNLFFLFLPYSTLQKL